MNVKRQIKRRLQRYRDKHRNLEGLPLLTRVNLKMAKNNKVGYATTGLSLAPSNESMLIDIVGLKGKNTCRYASPTCRKACLKESGNNTWDSSQIARIAKTLFLVNYRDEFIDKLCREVERFIKRCKKHKVRPAIRINILSDETELSLLMARMYPEVTFYDYTKEIKYWLDPANQYSKPSNYHLAYSLSEVNTEDWLNIMRTVPNARGAVVFYGDLPKTFKGFPVVDGDAFDAFFMQKQKGAFVLGLKVKGRAQETKDIALEGGFAQIGNQALLAA